MQSLSLIQKGKKRIKPSRQKAQERQRRRRRRNEFGWSDVAPELNAKSFHQWPGKIPIMDHVTDRANHPKFHPALADAAGWEVFSTDGHYFVGRPVRNFMDNSVDAGDGGHLSWTKWSQ